MQQISPKKPAREFLGKISGFSDKNEANFHKKMLRAYIQGNQRFIIGRNPDTKEPVYADDPQRYNTPKKMGGKNG